MKLHIVYFDDYIAFGRGTDSPPTNLCISLNLTTEAKMNKILTAARPCELSRKLVANTVKL